MSGRKIEEKDSQGLVSSLCQRDIFSEATHWNPDFDQEAFKKNDITSYIQQGKHDEIRDMIRNGHSINLPDEYGDPPLVTAMNFGTLETALLLLQLGANPNVATLKSPPSYLCDHVLKQVDKIPQIVLLLSYGADPFENSYEFNSAITEQRLLHLLVYFYWQKIYPQDHSALPPKPNSVSELNNLVLTFPLLQISGIMSLFHGNLLSLTTPIEHIAPPLQKRLLREFVDFITN
ncbi:hypothetical protein [Endozoicomonas atrinae]|uniref:hypothetical protein n=1 Tax=Endozoicomonas atrinae TaxID=1333660 RepID=UPI003AFFFE62